MPHYFIGIDPGLSGCCVVQDHHGNVNYLDCPIFGSKSDIKRHATAEMFKFLLPYRSGSAVLELVRIDQRDTGHMVSAEKLIRTHEAWRSCLELLEIPTQHLYPVQWRKPLGLSGDNGDVYVDAALRLYPQCRSWLYYKARNGKWSRNHNRAEALLMSHLSKMSWQEAVA